MYDVSDLLGEAGFPTWGSLYVFNEWGGEIWGHEPDARGNWAVFHAETPSSDLRRIDYPMDLEQQGRFAPCALQTFEAVSYPGDSDPRRPSEDFRAYARSIQDVVEFEFARTTDGGPSKAPLDLLFEIVSDSAPGWMWDDVGSLYYLVERADLESRRFENVRMVLQCY